MTKTETMKVLSILKATYPAHYKGMADADLHAMVDVWTDILGDADYMQVTMAVKEYIATDESGFPPAIGKLNHIMHSRFDGETLTPQEASAGIPRQRPALRHSGTRIGICPGQILPLKTLGLFAGYPQLGQPQRIYLREVSHHMGPHGSVLHLRNASAV